MVASTSDWAAFLGDMLSQKSGGPYNAPQRQGSSRFGNQALGPHFAAWHPCFAEQGAAAAQQPFLAEQGAAAQQPALVALAFLSFFGFAEHAPQLLRETGAQVAEAALGATAIARPPATASMVVRLSDFDINILLFGFNQKGAVTLGPEWAHDEHRETRKITSAIRKFSAIHYWPW